MLNGGEGLGWGEASRLFRNWRVPYAINKKKQTNKLVKELERNDFFLLKWQISMCVNVRVRACTYVYEWLEGIVRKDKVRSFAFVFLLFFLPHRLPPKVVPDALNIFHGSFKHFSLIPHCSLIIILPYIRVCMCICMCIALCLNLLRKFIYRCHYSPPLYFVVYVIIYLPLFRPLLSLFCCGFAVAVVVVFHRFDLREESQRCGRN
ncbi:hypothetical protein TbgDal_VIII3180 [Trypanosoma brucei gambiense DAL972]|uniref:Uncharacterized protein n=1 Tax=Trypanosoma brucei gambiense (strain MHOM/CI/86/DAL972) TaxID=679716 RepID=C9ZVD2_TRYB9|nr:hypothetical protein TbgDal_VIII3180 [Trypanosoma brucei gambiense DAL972]CBH13370.1 hypothetical protein TbgDal_VIII3180 [Trypanosoma brucei gambiense DAL972]|eukprot:XP_011775647.1 hypothetical protein TbgDal_VIII3180 [Trypanosoma brucei gambiense DAL972]